MKKEKVKLEFLKDSTEVVKVKVRAANNKVTEKEVPEHRKGDVVTCGPKAAEILVKSGNAKILEGAK